MRRLTEAGARGFVAVGPGKVLSGLIKKIARTARVFSVNDAEGLGRVEQALRAGEMSKVDG